jgi:hypothetical protein
MATVYDGLDDGLTRWLLKQPMFFVATAPLAADGSVNCSPKGLTGTFTVLDERTVAYLDITGSGIETVAHLRENGRIVLMFCAFDGRPRIVRLHGRGQVVLPDDERFAGLTDRFSPHPGVRSVILVDVTRVADSCGYGVPRLDFTADRDVLAPSHTRKGEAGLVTYRAEKNATSIDGLPGYPSPQTA